MNNTERTTGVIVERKNKGLDFPTLITVEYVVNEHIYHITESVKYKVETIKLCGIPIGQKKVSILPATTVGTQLTVVYNPDAPQNACIADNRGNLNC